jgi:predicted ester cyclase
VPAAGNAVSFEELTLSEEIGDLVTKQFSYFDLMSLLRQIGSN